MIGLRLSEKSPFSAASNPSIHLLVHIVGSLFGVPRSKNAIMVEHTTLAPLSVNAAIIFIANRHNINLDMMFGGSRDKARNLAMKKSTATAGKVKPIEIPGGQLPEDALGWLNLYRNRQFKFSEAELSCLEDAAKKITDYREGTVGEWVAGHFIGLLTKS